MNDARTGGHLLHVAGADQLRFTCRVFVQFLARKNVGYGLKAPMWVIRRAECLPRRVIHGTNLIEHQKGIKLIQALRRDWAANEEPCALPLLMGCDDGFDVARRRDRLSSVQRRQHTIHHLARKADIVCWIAHGS